MWLTAIYWHWIVLYLRTLKTLLDSDMNGRQVIWGWNAGQSIWIECIGVDCFWQYQQEINRSRLSKNAKRKMQWYRKAEYNLEHFWNIFRGILSGYVAYLGREENTACCSRDEANKLVWFKAGVWQLRYIRRQKGKRICPLYLGNEDV